MNKSAWAGICENGNVKEGKLNETRYLVSYREKVGERRPAWSGSGNTVPGKQLGGSLALPNTDYEITGYAVWPLNGTETVP
jgi:hypothetical protein